MLHASPVDALLSYSAGKCLVSKILLASLPVCSLGLSVVNKRKTMAEDSLTTSDGQNAVSVRKKLQRSGSFCEGDGTLKAGRLTVSLPKRSHSFRSCLKKPTVEEESFSG